MTFSLDDVPDQTGKSIIITGASSGIGLSAARMLAKKGGHVIMACRNLEKAQPLADSINEDAAAVGGKATVLRLDTTDLDSIDAFAKELKVERLDSLILNAGIMAVPYHEIATRSAKHPKMESQMACNVVGHFYLVHALKGLLRASPGVRVVFVASIAATITKPTDSITYDVFACASPLAYNASSAYNESKLGCLLLAHELRRRCAEWRVDASVVPMHPGIVKTGLFDNATGFIVNLFVTVTKLFRMGVDEGGLILAVAGALPNERVPEKAYFAPNGTAEYTGRPWAEGKMPKQGVDGVQAKRLWEMCEELCGVKTEI